MRTCGRWSRQAGSSSACRRNGRSSSTGSKNRAGRRFRSVYPEVVAYLDAHCQATQTFGPYRLLECHGDGA